MGWYPVAVFKSEDGTIEPTCACGWHGEQSATVEIAKGESKVHILEQHKNNG